MVTNYYEGRNFERKVRLRRVKFMVIKAKKNYFKMTTRWLNSYSLVEYKPRCSAKHVLQSRE
jgi:hypothetical protein